MSGGLALWTAAVMASSFVPAGHKWAFFACRALVGIGEASYSTVAPTIIADLFARDLRSRMLMIFFFAIPVGRSPLHPLCFILLLLPCYCGTAAGWATSWARTWRRWLKGGAPGRTAGNGV